MAKLTYAQKKWTIQYHVKAEQISPRKKVRKQVNTVPHKNSLALLETYEEVMEALEKEAKKYHDKHNHR